jgi:hypothetical protein
LDQFLQTGFWGFSKKKHNILLQCAVYGIVFL